MASSDLGAIAEVVPQISYDILGRIVPGSVVLVSLWVAAVGPGPAIAEVRAALGSDNPGLIFRSIMYQVLSPRMYQ